MESVVIIIGIVVGVAAFANLSKRRAAEKARLLAEEQAKRRKEAEDRRRAEEARRIETERQAARNFRISIKNDIIVAVNAATEAAVIGTGIAEVESRVVHIVASAIEAVGVGESSDARLQVSTGEIEFAHKLAFTDAVARSDEKATAAARKAATLDPEERIKVIQDARRTAIEAAMAITIKDTVAILRANGEPRRITNARANSISPNTRLLIGKAAQEIDNERAAGVNQTRISENERIQAIIDTIETEDETHKSMAASLGADGRAKAIKRTRKSTHGNTVQSTLRKAVEFVVTDANTQVALLKSALVPNIMAKATYSVLDRIEDAIEDAIAWTCMQTGSIQESVAPYVASDIEITTQDLIDETMNETAASEDDEEYSDENYDVDFDVDYESDDDPNEILDQLNVSTVNYVELPKLEHPEGYVYVIQDISHTKRYKIGRTSHPATRINSFGVELPFETEIVAILRTTNAVDLERDLHNQFATSRTQGEWFDLTGAQVREICNL